MTDAQLLSIDELVQTSFPTVMSLEFIVLATSLDCGPDTQGKEPIELPTPSAKAFAERLQQATGQAVSLKRFCLEEEAKEQGENTPTMPG